MKTRSTLAILLIANQISFAQESKVWLSLGAGINHASNQNKSNLIGNGVNLQADAFVPFYRKGWDGTVKGGSFTLGVNVIGNYASINNLSPDNAQVQNRYQIYNGALTVASQAASKKSASFSGLVGFQGRFSFGKFNVAPSLNAGYLNFKKEGYEQIGSASINGQTRQLELIMVEDQSSGGFVFKPQLKVGYSLIANLSVFVSPAVVMGHEVVHTVQQRVPQGGFNEKNTYEASQLANGTWESKTTTSKYHFSELNFGLALGLGKKKPKNAGLGLGGGAASASYARMAAHSNEVKKQDSAVVRAETVNPLYNGNIGAGQNPMSENKVAISKETKDKTFGETMAGGLQTAGNAVAQETTNGKATKKESSASKKTADPTNEEATDLSKKAYDYKASSEMTKSVTGQPIGGIVVKGGKNPGGKLISTTTNEKGEFEFAVVEAGSYKFSFANPAQDFNTTRNNKERGQLAAVPRNPIGGIIVKGGKNPGGNFITVTSTPKGEVIFDDLAEGNYLFQIVMPSQPAAKTGVRTYTGGRKNEPQGKSISEQGVSGSKPKTKKKVREKAASGLKDNLKTNV